jgi:hypothetical protein
LHRTLFAVVLALLGSPISDAAEPGAARGHWSFRPVSKPAVPRQPPADGNKIDAFLLAKLNEQGLAPAKMADPRALIRRVTFDLIGLPPTPEEIEDFLRTWAAKPQAAYETLVDRLLASPHYGEKWGRHWLDVVRYADTAGETADFPVPQAWRYRNYVIDSFNTDKPFDQFVREQIAGDLLAKADARGKYAELVTATGYLAVARRFGFDVQADHYLTIEDTIDTLGKSLLGLTVGCARCHDHKYEPITQQDYYALYGILESTRFPRPGCEKDKRQHDFVPLAPPAALALIGGAAGRETAYAVSEGQPHDAQIQKRGNPDERGNAVPRRWLRLFGSQPVPADGGSGRLALAGWLTSRENPLVARVFVNRVWQGHFGHGIVDTPNDFGSRGSPPSHPELLDYLAARFVEEGWSVKKLHRLILHSAAYRRSANDPASVAKDPGNVWLARFQRRRLTAEEVRDAILAVSGDLDRTPGGPHPFPPEHTWGFTQHAPFTAVYDHDRRSVYLMTQRIKRHPFLALFDGPDPNASTPHRDATTVPAQALFFLNDPFVHAKAEKLAARLLALPDDNKRLERLTTLCFGRPPTEAERSVAAKFLAAYDRHRAWAAWVRVTLAGNEFLYLD